MKGNNSLSNKTKIIIAFLGLFIGLIILREVGIVDLHLYKSLVNKNQTATLVTSFYSESVGDGETTSLEDLTYNYDLYYNNEKSKEIHYKGDNDSIKLNVFIVTGKFDGNYYLPFYKKFKVDYTAKIENANEIDRNTIDGDIKGTVEVIIKGVCSRRKAIEIANENIILAVREYTDTIK